MMSVVYPSLIEQPGYSTSADDYVRWVSARKSMHKAVSAAIHGGLVINRALILGAGTCQDLPMDFLLDECGEIVLVDKYEKVLKKSSKFTLGSEHKVKRVITDITGLNNAAIRNKSALDHALHYRSMSSELAALGEFDLVVSDLMISVMSESFIFDECSRDENRESADRITKAHLGDIEKLCRPGGCAVITHDLCGCGSSNDKRIRDNNKILDGYPQLSPDTPDIPYVHLVELLITEQKLYVEGGTFALCDYISELSIKGLRFHASPFWWSYHQRTWCLCCTYAYQNIKER